MQQSPSPAQLYENSIVPAIFVPWTGRMLDLARPGDDETVLDLACATGMVSRMVAPLVERAGKVIGVDVSEEMLAVARAIGERERLDVDWLLADAAELPLPDDSVDLVICQQGIQFFENPAGAAAEIHRVLKDDGRAVVSVWLDLEYQPVYRALLEAEAEYLQVPVQEVATPFKYGDARRLRSELAGAGFDGVEITTETKEVSFTDPDTFVAMTLVAGTALLPEAAPHDDSELLTLVEAISTRAEATVGRYRDDGKITFPMHAYLAVARK